MININGTLINLYHVCKREMWLHYHGIRMEHNSDSVYEGKLISESTFTKRSEKGKELEIAGIKIDHYDAKNKIVHEVKKSNKAEQAHQWQVKYYLLVLEQHGIKGVKGILEYPKIRQKEEILLSDTDRTYFRKLENEIPTIVANKSCPPLLNKAICKSCSYYDFCYSNENE